MATISLISIIWKIFKLPTPQSLGLRFSECQRKWNISISHYKKLQNGCHFININHTEKFQITDPPPKFGSLVFWVWMETEYQHWPLWKNWKMAATSLIWIIRKNFKLLTPPSLDLWFSKCWQKQYQHQPLWKHWKMAAILLILIIRKIFKLPTPPQSLGLRFSEWRQKWNISVSYYENIEKWLPFH